MEKFKGSGHQLGFVEGLNLSQNILSVVLIRHCKFVLNISFQLEWVSR